MESTAGLLIQFTGISLIATLLLLLTRSLKAVALRYWAASWCALAGALFSLFLAFGSQGVAAKGFLTLYYLGEYASGFFLISGCHNYATETKISRRSWWLLLPGALLAAGLSYRGSDMNSVFNFHSFIYASMFVLAYIALRPVCQSQRNCFGWGVMRVALALLACDFFQYSVTFSFQHSFFKPVFSIGIFTYNSIIDLVLEILLGFGMVIVLLEQVQIELIRSNEELKETHDKLAQIVNIDPLTEAFNRHAFHNLLHDQNENRVAGCVGALDIDNLKPINDHYGHAAGDSAIRAVASAIRSLIRADDLLFRWGGDEFFVVMFNMDNEQACHRMMALPSLLGKVNCASTGEVFSVEVSFGFANFNTLADLESAIQTADATMYRTKQERKRALPVKQDLVLNVALSA